MGACHSRWSFPPTVGVVARLLLCRAVYQSFRSEGRHAARRSRHKAEPHARCHEQQREDAAELHDAKDVDRIALVQVVEAIAEQRELVENRTALPARGFDQRQPQRWSSGI